MATSKVQICNMALAAIGTRSTIADMGESSTEADACNAQYDAALEAVLQTARWNFARGQVVLTLLRDATLTPPDPVPAPWAYEYAYPSDCVRVRYLMPSLPTAAGIPGQAGTSGGAVRFIVGTDKDLQGNDAKVILTNQPAAILVYTRRVTNVSLFDGQFVVVLANYLGALICMGLTGDRARRDEAFKLADSTSKDARTSNGNEGLTIIDGTPDWIRAHGYAADFGQAGGSMFWAQPVDLSLIP